MPLLRTHNAQISYTKTGSGPAALLIQGVGVIGEGWRPQIDALSSHFTIIAFDNRGIGRSVMDVERFTIEAMADDAIAIMDAEGIEQFHVIGHSMGGLIAQEIALRVRHRVKSLSLLCTFARGKDATALSWRMLLLGLWSRIGTRQMRRDGMLRIIMPVEYLRQADRQAFARQLQHLFGRDLADQPPIVMTQLRAMSQYSTVDRLADISGIPTLVVSAAHDPIAPPQLGRAIAAAIDGARYVEFPHASHAVPIQCADEVNALLIEHLAAAERGVERSQILV